MKRCKDKCRKCHQEEPGIPKFTEIPGRMIETKNEVETKIKKKVRGKIMKTLFKFLFKLIWKLSILAAAMCAVVYLLNKFAPDTFDSLTDWIKEQRDE